MTRPCPFPILGFCAEKLSMNYSSYIIHYSYIHKYIHICTYMCKSRVDIVTAVILIEFPVFSPIKLPACRLVSSYWRNSESSPTEMGAPRKWIKNLLGLKKSDKLVSSEEGNSSRSTDEIWLQRKHSTEFDNGVFENELNQDVDIEFKDANMQSVWDPGSSPSTSHEVQNAPELQWSMREEWKALSIAAKDANFHSASDPAGSPSTSLQVQTAAQFNMREEWAAIDTTHANFQSVPGPTSSPSTSLQVKNAAQPQQNIGYECAAINAKDADFQSALDPTSPPFTSLHGQHAAQLQRNMSEDWAAMRIQTAFRGFLLSTSVQLQNEIQLQQNMSEESAAIRIQTAFRGFLARRTLHGLKGLGRLQALVGGHAVRRQPAITLRCMQALVKVQARTRARHARVALENQAAQQKLQEQQEHECQVKKIEDGWCDSAGSANEVQAKLLKRKEAAAKREKAKAYAQARQWQARSKQQVTPVGFEPDKGNWGWNWLERWMAVRPWENRISDINLQEGMKILENESGHAENAPKTPLSNSGKGKSGSRLSTLTNISIEKRATFLSDGSFSPSPNRSGNASPATLVSSRTNSKPVVRKSDQEARPYLGPRSLSNPKERSTLPEKLGIKRLSLPGVVQGAQSAAKSSPTPPRPVIGSPIARKAVTARNKSLNGNDVKSSNLSRQVSH